MALRAQSFYLGPNALGLYDFKQGDANKLSGFVLDAGATGSVTGSVQTVTSETLGDGIASEPMLFPFEGATLIASADFSTATVRFRIGVRFLDVNKAVLSESHTDYIAAGRRSHVATVPENTVYVQWISTREEASAADGGNWSFERPALRTNSSAYSE